MAMPQTIEAVRHPYTNGEVKRMLINGEWADHLLFALLKEDVQLG